MSENCRICGKPKVDDDTLTEFDDIDWSESQEEAENYRLDLCWCSMDGYCRDENNNQIDSSLAYVCDQRDKLLEENKQLKATLNQILGESPYTPKPSEVDRLEETKEYIRNINALRRKSKIPL